jgi:FlaA1/EpsC-like NDP-sugar epimerase
VNASSRAPSSGLLARLKRRPVQYLLDVAALSAAFVLSYLIRFEFTLSHDVRDLCLRQLPLVVLIQFAALSVFGVYAFIWRYVGIAELQVFVRAAVTSFVPLLAMRLAFPESLRDFRVPLSILLLDAGLAFSAVVGLRILRRLFFERYEKGGGLAATDVEKKRALLVGAGRAGVLAAKEILGREDSGFDVRGFVDDDPLKQDSVILGLRVLGPTASLKGLVKHLAIDEVVITIAQAPRREIRRIVRICEEIPVKVRIMPGIWEILQGNVKVSSIRDVEIEDLLGRDPVRLDEEQLRAFLSGRRVLVTGAGGSIGSELCRQVARLAPASLLLVERAEFVLFDVDREIRRLWPDLNVVPLVGDVGDESRMRSIFEVHRPEVVLHAAAHKHVPLMEGNPGEAIRNNTLATRTLGRVAGESGAEVFVLISTDKAVRPTSVMGASKRLAELVVQDLDGRFPTRFLAVRFGNVLGSTGSVIPIFREQIRAGRPVTVTHPDMVRFFMTIPEASQLVLQAGAMGKGGEIFILDMGEPVKILDLARDMISLSGLRPGEDVEIVFTGMRPGEKLYEEVATTGENVARTGHPKIFVGTIRPIDSARLEAALGDLEASAWRNDEAAIREMLGRIIPEAALDGHAVTPVAAAST